MNYSKFSKLFLILFLALFTITSCNKDSFLNVNADPNRATDDNITPYLIFSQAAHAAGVRQFGNLDFLQSWMGYQAQSGDFVPDASITTYTMSADFSDDFWANNYNVLYDLSLVKKKGYAIGDSGVASAAVVLSAQLYQNLVDVFGNIPYSQAFNTLEFPNPKYDTAKNIYDSLQKSLDIAISYFDRNSPTSAFIACDDIFNKEGKPSVSNLFSSWIKYANTLKLRLLLRQSEVAGFNPAPEIAKIIAKGGVLGGGQTVSVNPGYVKSLNQQSPFYATYGFSPTSTDANTATRANQYFDDILTTVKYPTAVQYVDKRETYFYAPLASGAVVGCTFGNKSYSQNDPTSNPRGTSSSKYGEGILKGHTQDQWILTSFESMFYKAEAIARGWMPGNAQQAYEDAVTESFVWLKVPNDTSEAFGYLNNSPIAQWSAPPAYFTSKAKFIAYQKYISLCAINPLEAWCDLRRLNMIPDKGYISVNPARISNVLPNRLKYPSTEFSTNSKNVRAQGTIDPFSSKLFWQP